jgi:nicotinate-nucleotide adenylyltransferase
MEGRRPGRGASADELSRVLLTLRPLGSPPGFASRITVCAVQRKIGVMGGTFDPIHHGHLVAASEVADRFGLDEVVFVPTGQPWQKSEREVSAAEDRYLMTVATASNPRFTVSRADIDRGGPTYTTDTLTDLHAQRPGSELYFITGADALAQILSWQKLDELFELAHFVGVTRPGYELDDHHLPDGAVTLVEVPAMTISSTDCRRRVAEGHPVWYLVPDGVVQYISKRGLYRDETDPCPAE